jgi:hypothetical protein
MADKLHFVGKNLSEELSAKVNEELLNILKQKDASFEWPSIRKTEKISHGDYTLVLSAVCGKKKINANDFTKDVAEFLNKTIVSSQCSRQCTQETFHVIVALSSSDHSD